MKIPYMFVGGAAAMTAGYEMDQVYGLVTGVVFFCAVGILWIKIIPAMWRAWCNPAPEDERSVNDDHTVS